MNEIGSDASKFASIFAGPMMLPLVTTAAIIPTASKITDSISSPTASSAMGVAKEQTITANLTIEVPVTLNGKQLDKQIIKKVIQLNGTGDSMTQRDAGSSRGIGFSGETSNKTST
jgi:hypothetical protein